MVTGKCKSDVKNKLLADVRVASLKKLYAFHAYKMFTGALVKTNDGLSINQAPTPQIGNIIKAQIKALRLFPFGLTTAAIQYPARAYSSFLDQDRA